MATTQQQPKAGDMIQVFRVAYQHWAIYVGNGYIVHVTTEEGESSIGSVFGGGAVVKKRRIMDVVGNDQWQVNNYWDKNHKPRPVAVMVKEALAQVGKKVHYDLLTKNCEHFATKLRYGEAHSWQGEVAVGALTLNIVKVLAEEYEQQDAQDAICERNQTSGRCVARHNP